MKRDYFVGLERYCDKGTVALSEIIDQLAFNERGLVPVITQDVSTKSVLMFAWMNKEALEQTLLTTRMTYWSRSREELWVKGGTSGHVQALKRMSVDCDGDVILCLVEQQSAPCHTGRQSCFYLHVDAQREQVWVGGEYR